MKINKFAFLLHKNVKSFLIFSLLLLLSSFITGSVLAEDKSYSGGMIPKLPKTANDPELLNGHVYPFWGPPCQRYTYSVVYRDKEGRKPQYMQIYFNGKMIDMQKENPNDNDYKKGVKYIYKYVPNKIDSTFYYFEASNGLGKARASIIDSPDNGPVLFTTAFNKNEIAVIDRQIGKKVLSYPTGKEWVGGVALSDDGKLLAVKTSQHVYLFDTSKPAKPLWQFNCEQCRIGDDVKGGVAISGDGSVIFAAFGERVALFAKSSNKPIWMYEKAGNAYNVAISKDGKYMAAATAGDEANTNSNLIILWNGKSEKPLWQYHASGNFHDVSLSDDGEFIAGSTGCPDRRFYLFSRDSNKPLIRTEPLTRDSPVHRAKISSDGVLAAVGSEADDGAVFLFSKDKGQVWKFSTPQRSSVRALNFTPNGRYIGAATFGGDAYIFDKDKNSPVASWKVNASLGGIDIADDGSFIAAGGTDNKLYIFDRDTKLKTEIPFDEYIEEVDISADGKYIAAGTGGSVYFFETYISQDRGKVFDCSSVIEPPSESQMMKDSGINESGEQVNSSLCGDGRCEGPEGIDNCRQDCDPKYARLAESKREGGGKGSPKEFGQKPVELFLAIRGLNAVWIFGLLGSVVIFGVYLALKKLKFLEKQKTALIKLNQARPLLYLRLNNKRMIIILVMLSSIFLVLTLVAIFMDKIFSQTVQKDFEIRNKNQQGICGNNLCEPGLGETQEKCPKDCSAGD